MKTFAERHVEQMLSCLMRSLPEDWESFSHITEFGEDSVLQYGSVHAGGKEENLRITQECHCASSMADIARLLYLAVQEATGESLAKMTIAAKAGEDASIVFEPAPTAGEKDHM